MGQQVTEARFNEVVFQPLEGVYGKIDNAGKKIWFQMLCYYPEDVLHNAVSETCSTMETRPKPAHLLGLCKKFNSTGSRSYQPETEVKDWRETASNDARKFTEDYLWRNETAKMAVAEGWINQFKKIVYNLAFVQAQGIHAPSNKTPLGYFAVDLPYPYTEVLKMDAYGFIRDLANLARMRGVIEVIFNDEQKEYIREIRRLHQSTKKADE